MEIASMTIIEAALFSAVALSAAAALVWWIRRADASKRR